MVRMLGGVHAGEVRNLPFLAARGAIQSGMARQIVDELEPAAVVPAIEMVATTVAQASHHKRPSRRR